MSSVAKPVEQANIGRQAPGQRLERNRNFNIFWLGQSLSALGDAFGFLALPLLVLQATGSVAQMGLVTGTMGVGQFISGVFAGSIVDRVDRRKLMIVCDIARALLYGLIPLTWLFFGPQVSMIYIVSLLGAVLGNTFQVANITALTNLVDKDQIIEANSRLQAAYAVTFIVGPALAGFVSQQFGPATAIGINAVSFIASALSLLFVRLRRAAAERNTEEMGSRLGEALAGFRFLVQHPVLRSVALLLAAFTFIGVAGLDLFIFHLKNDLGQDDNTVGVVFAIASLGSLIGAMLGSRLRRRWGFAVCWLGASFVGGLALLLIAPASGVLMIGGMSALFLFAQTVQGINGISYRQEVTPDHLLGRVTSAYWLVATVPGPIGAAIATALAEQAGAPFMLAVMGIGTMVLSLLGLLTPIRGQDAGKIARVAKQPAETA